MAVWCDSREPRVTVYTDRGLASATTSSGASSRMWKAASGRRQKNGLTRFVNGAFEAVTTNDGLPEGRDLAGAAAIGRPGINGLRPGSLDGRSLRFGPDVPGIPWDRVAFALEDRSGTLWLGIRDGGLMRVRDGRATHLGARMAGRRLSDAARLC